jgi:hypothetical protein
MTLSLTHRPRKAARAVLVFFRDRMTKDRDISLAVAQYRTGDTATLREATHGTGMQAEDVFKVPTLSAYPDSWLDRIGHAAQRHGSQADDGSPSMLAQPYLPAGHNGSEELASEGVRP